MTPAETTWLPGILMLVGGGVIGAVLVYWSSRRKGPRVVPAVRPLGLRELLAKRDALVERLREMDDTASKRTAEQLARERYEVELEAAAVMRAIDDETTELESLPTDVETGPVRRSGIAGFVWGVASAGAVAALVFFVGNASKDRAAGMPATGQPGAATQGGEAGMPHPDVASLEQRVRENSEDLEARLMLAQMYLIQNNLMGTFEQTQYVLEREPRNPVAMAYQAVVKLAMGAPADAIAMLDQAIAIDPGLLDAWAHKAIALAMTGRLDEAEAVIREAERRFPQAQETLENLLSQIRGAAARGTGTESAAMGGQSPVPMAPRTDAAPAESGIAAGERVGGTIAVDASIAGRIRYPATLFVDARPEGVSEGAPVAALRLSVSAFPVVFSLGPENSMMGGRLPRRVRIEARIDSDGDVATKEPNAPRGVMDGVDLGSNDLRVVIR